ncbi:hypothetical protein AVEN_82680-1 [Araneus ventricosus]|uniref:Uncharacterized protein n=1 Tax=Araneus ventricosus TaxID=182803 RepID=A0A4Y2WVK8_ARAVE|nr:hypothetical protein AVEN_245137-1 [Araneus ventricosus]GBO41485.1 hypothetical protein AVEN_82680-1 [Araneus ventricosus]
MSKGAKQVPVTPRHSESLHPVHRHLRSAEGPGSPRGVPNSGKRCLPLKAGTPGFLFLGFDSAPATAPSQKRNRTELNLNEPKPDPGSK